MHRIALSLLTAGLMVAAAGATANPTVNVNEADFDELQTLTGVGPATAEAIIEARTQLGEFQSIDELTRVNGIGEATLERMQDQVIVE
ncbi:hypothetical protein GJ672_03420 [Spiribacter sp. 2438]|uniref:ComEA family DNA-binding protein n=1 Tax=Spiribacter sp. 2438 TaxID=2666185 RepID=UPI0012B0B3D9|nr:helix-hairpin-helix domain-containing protein [Spiribacter sp. 2438]QGM21407.1 hypothetical protein GJ672_03420 [Spiribacter sp. 2438]